MTVLKGGISYTKGEEAYIWHSTSSACEACQALNGTTFNDINEIPDKPHPNCRCWVEDKKENKNEEEKDALEEIVSDIYSLKDEINEVINSIHNRSIVTSQETRLFGEYVRDLESLNDDCDNLLSIATADIEYMLKKQIINLISNLSNELDFINKQFETIYNALNKEIKNIEQQNKINENFKNDYKKHDELKQLLLHHHDNSGLTPLPENYNLIQTIHDSQTELDLEIFEHENELILSFPGSQLPQDGKTDLDIKVNHKNPQLEKAQDILDKIKNNPNYKDYKIITTGYSLGGNIAGGLSVLNNIEGVTFNPYGDLNNILQQKANDSNETIEINPYKLINYRHEDDWLSRNTKTENLGQQYELPKLVQNKGRFDIVNHNIKNIGDSISRYPQNNKLEKSVYYPKLLNIPK